MSDLEHNITTSFEDWKSALLNRSPNASYSYEFDFSTADRIKNLFDGFMTAPVATIGDTPIEAKSFVLDQDQLLLRGVEYFRTEFENSFPGKKLYLYQLYFVPSRPAWVRIDPTTFENILLDIPVMSPSGWKIRIGAGAR